jgi:hypothetical protein
MSRGRAARVAIDPETFLAYLDERTSTITAGSPRRTRRILNGHTIDQANDGRMLRRWRSGTIEGITQPAVERFLARYDLTFNDFTLWAATGGLRTFIRNSNQQENITT